MLVPVGQTTVTAATARAVVGSFTGDLVNGLLLLKMSTLYPSNMSGLAYGIVSLVEDDTGVRVLGDARYHPKPEPTVIALGYGDLQSVSGTVIFEPRGYNLRWLEREGSSRFWRIAVEAETPAGIGEPAFTPTAYADGAIQLSAAAVSGTDGATYGQVSWYE